MNDSAIWQSIKGFYNEIIAPNKKTAALILFLILIAYASLLVLPKDNPIEQEAEKIIEEETGIKIDLTP